MMALGWLALVVGIVGVFVPLLPTTPLVLLAVFFFSKGSQRLHLWLIQHRHLGRYARDWEREQVIPPVGKYASTLLMVPSVGLVILTGELSPMPSGAMLAALVAVLWFIWSRPARPGRGVQDADEPHRRGANPRPPIA